MLNGRPIAAELVHYQISQGVLAVKFALVLLGHRTNLQMEHYVWIDFNRTHFFGNNCFERQNNKSKQLQRKCFLRI